MTGTDSSRKHPRYSGGVSGSKTGRAGGTTAATTVKHGDKQPSSSRWGSRSSDSPYSHSSAPTAVRRRGGGPQPPPGASPTSSRAAGAGAGKSLAGSWEADDGFGSGADDSRDVVPRMLGGRDHIREILDRSRPDPDPDWAAAAGTPGRSAPEGAEDAALPPTEQDSSCEVAAAGIILACQDSGVCDVAMRGVTRLPPSLLKFFRAEGGLISELHLQGNRLTSAPPLDHLPGLIRLDLSTNMLSVVPDSLGKLRRLRSLDLSRNQHLAELPDSLCDLTGLTSLDLSHNVLECLPLRLGQLQRLVELRLDENRLAFLPAGCVGLPSLTALHASHNRITALPSELGGASSLTGIFVAHNKLTALPGTIGLLRQRLSELQLHNNELTVLPREMGLLASLTRITTSRNPLIHPPLEIARKGVAAVREYLLGSWQGQLEEPEGDEQCTQDGEEAGAAAGGRQPGAGGAPSLSAEGPSPRAAARDCSRSRLVLGSACKFCVDKDDRFEELGQLLREARERLERSERQLEQAREQHSRQARDLAQQATRAVEAEAERTRLMRQLEAAALLPGYRGPAFTAAAVAGARTGGGGAVTTAGSAAQRAPAAVGEVRCVAGDRSQGEVVAHLREELRAAMGTAEVAQGAAEAAEREARKLRREAEDWRQQFKAERERAEELVAALAKERERCNAAVAAATEATHKFEDLHPVVKEREKLQKNLEVAKGVNADAWRAADVAREGHLVSQAAADMMQGRLTALEAAHARLGEQLEQERTAAAVASAAASSRERQLQLEISRLQAEAAALMAEREVLHGVGKASQEGRSSQMLGGCTVSPLPGVAQQTANATAITTQGRFAWTAPQII